METISPSPSGLLSSSVIVPAPEPSPPFASVPTLKPKSANKPTSKSRNAATKNAKKDAGTIKPKQSKSRNGCVTCKAKRLKCDEVKPTCQQCNKRSVPCGGYKKDFKWRPFEETIVQKAPAKPKQNKHVASEPEKTLAEPGLNPARKDSYPTTAISPASNGTSSTPDAEGEEGIGGEFFSLEAAPNLPRLSSSHDMSDPIAHFNQSSMYTTNTPPFSRELPRPRFEPDTITRSLSSLFDELSPPSMPSPRPSFSGQSPRLIDLLMPGSELNARPGSVTLPPLYMPTPAMSLSPMITPQFCPPTNTLIDDDMEHDVEEITREPPESENNLWMSLRGPLYPSSSSASPTIRDEPMFTFYRQPEVQAGSPEMLMLRFDKQTCGILSVKDGPTENPWRTLVWPLARDSPALYHAIASMTAFHTSKERPALRMDGMEHMRSSIQSLANGIEKMRTDTALATTLVLAFSESWDQHISTGIEHLRGAKILVNQALIAHQKNALRGDDLARLKFLCNTWVYMDVIARLTSIDQDDCNDFDHVIESINTSSLFSNDHSDIDPLMGCAATLFPLIGRAANLCRKVRRFETNSIQIISQAIELKEAIEQWLPQPSSAFERPEDPTSEIQHALQTAEAYRYATLLYLHQAVPEIPSLSSAQLAKKVLVFLATVPLSSRFVIVQIYPLLAAGCEAYELEDRQWVEERWRSMANRMWIGNIDRCWEVMQEVWTRRDSHEAAKAESRQRKSGAGPAMTHSESSKRKFEEELAFEDGFSFSDLLNGTSSSTGRDMKQRTNSQGGSFSIPGQHKRLEPSTEEMDVEVTVRGRLHWVGVMKDWEWEILLG